MIIPSDPCYRPDILDRESGRERERGGGVRGRDKDGRMEGGREGRVGWIGKERGRDEWREGGKREWDG